MELPTLVTVTYNTWETYTQRLIEQVCHYINPNDYKEWLMVDNASSDGEKIDRNIDKIPIPHRQKFSLIRSDLNIGDLPQYNRVFRFSSTDKIIALSTDIRICESTVNFFSRQLDTFDIAGTPGPNLPKGMENPAIGGNWHWVPKLLVERGIEFDYTMHIQTWAFGVRLNPFIVSGGFWEPEDEQFLDKGNLIAGEISGSLRMRQHGFKVGLCFPIPAFHYGNVLPKEGFNAFDQKMGWPAFPRIEWDV